MFPMLHHRVWIDVFVILKTFSVTSLNPLKSYMSNGHKLTVVLVISAPPIGQRVHLNGFRGLTSSSGGGAAAGRNEGKTFPPPFRINPFVQGFVSPDRYQEVGVVRRGAKIR